MWYLLNNIRRSEQDEISAEVHLPTTSPWFDGHFPGEPILPGLAQIGMVYDVIRIAWDDEVYVSSVSRVRFKRIVRPGDVLKVVVSSMQEIEGKNAFRILSGQDQVCSGVVRLRNVADRTQRRDRNAMKV